MKNLFTIDCGEILLREFSVEDVDAIYEITSQAEVYTYLTDWKEGRYSVGSVCTYAVKMVV